MKFVTINFWGNEPDVSARLKLAISQLRHINPDVIAMQEVRPLNGRDGETTADVIATELGMVATFEETIAWNDGAFFEGHPGGKEGLAILTKDDPLQVEVLRLPEARPTEKRILLSVRLGNGWAHSTHLHYRLADGVARESQVAAICDRIGELDGPHVLMGDFNAAPQCDEIRYMRGETSIQGKRTHWQDAFDKVHPGSSGLTWSAENPQTRPLRSLDIDRRIDYIFVSTRKKSGVGTVRDAGLCLDERDSQGNCCSDHYGVWADVQLTENLQ